MTPDIGLRWKYRDTLLVVFAGLVAGVIGTIIALLAGGADVDMVQPGWIFWVILPCQLLGQLAAIVGVSKMRGTGNLERDFGFSIDLKDIWYLAVGGVVLFATGLIAETIRTIIGASDENPQGLIEIVDGIGNTPTVGAMVLGIVIMGPIVEELTFRGLLLQTILQRFSATAAIVGSALAFSLVHVADPALISLDGIPTLAALFMVGLVLGWVTVRSDSLSRAIFLHGGFNLTTTMVLLFGPGTG